MISSISAAAEPSSAAAFWTARLQRDGYVIIPNAIDPATLDGFYEDIERTFDETPYCSGPFYGETTKRFGRLLLRSERAARFACNPLVLEIARSILLHPLCNTILLNLTQAIEIHPGAPLQYPHRDQDMFGGPKGDQQYMMNVMWALDDFTADNGATRIWPRSHLADPDGMLPEEEAVTAVMPRGSALIFLGSALHSGGENLSAQPRRGAIFSYCQGWLRPWENPWLAYPPEVARNFEPELADLVGYRQHLPSLGNFEGQCPSVLLQEKVPESLGFIDSLRGDQAELVREYQHLNGRRQAA